MIIGQLKPILERAQYLTKDYFFSIFLSKYKFNQIKRNETFSFNDFKIKMKDLKNPFLSIMVCQETFVFLK